jgi:hypothetical protein
MIYSAFAIHYTDLHRHKSDNIYEFNNHLILNYHEKLHYLQTIITLPQSIYDFIN